jgi:hypothetical protein
MRLSWLRKQPETRAGTEETMAGAGRRMSGSFVSVARSVVRISTNSSSEVVAAGGKRGVGSRSMAPPGIPVATKPASFSCFCSKSVSESKRSASLFFRYFLSKDARCS